MENENIIVNEEVMDVAEEISTGSGKGWKLGLGAVAIAGIAYGAHKLIKKLKAKKEQEEETVDVVYTESGENVEVETK